MIQITYHAHTILCFYTDEPMKNMSEINNCVLLCSTSQRKLKFASGSCRKNQ